MENSFLFEKVPHSMIVKLSPLSDLDSFIKKVMKGIICPQHGCGQCQWCHKIDDNKYFDLQIFDGKEIKKQDVVSLIERYSHPGLESCNKQIYVIKNIEYASKYILNSLLKFLEEPPVGVYAILTTRNYDAILPTIRSRCHCVFLPKNEDAVDAYLNSKTLSLSEKQLIKKCFFDFETLKEKYDDFIKYYELIKKLASIDSLLFANEGLSLFRKLDYSDINLFLDICKNLYPTIAINVIAIQDVLYLNSPKSLIYHKIYSLLSGVNK